MRAPCWKHSRDKRASPLKWFLILKRRRAPVCSIGCWPNARDRRRTCFGAETQSGRVCTTALNFPAGTTSQIISVGIRGDAIIESNETFFVNLTTPANLVLATNRAIVTILDDDFRLIAIQVSGRDVVLRFNTVAGQSNRVEWTGELTSTSVWTTVAGAANVPGTGSVAQIIEIDGATLPQRFYRIRRLP